jgi:iron complex outermembrane receptor protein
MKKYAATAARGVVIVAVGMSVALNAAAQSQDTGFADMSLEQLMNVPVTSVSKKATKLGESPAAITVITQEDLRRLGITNLPDALRLVPGVEVAQINSQEWAVSARGFNNEFANKLLVLIDGRSVYGSGFGGVVWGVQNVVMEDVDRIEVIRGPGGALWGANAVNGVINIITKGAAATQGGLVSAAGGTTEQPDVAARYGGTIGANATYRAYLKYNREDNLETQAGGAVPDQTHDMQAGGRMDWTPTRDDHLTLQGDYYVDRFTESQVMPNLVPPYDWTDIVDDRNTGGNALARWTHQLEENSSLAIQAYVDTFHQEQAGAFQAAQTVDFDAQHRFSLWDRNDVVWGLGYRHIDGSFGNSPFVSWNPDHYIEQLYSVFVQDEISVVPDRLSVTVGSKVEHNIYTGFETQPSLRMAFKPTGRQTLWAAVSRAVRTPSRSDLTDLVNLAVVPPTATAPEELISSAGNFHLEAEELLAYELGYRVEIGPAIAVDMTAFHNHYDRIILQSLVTPQFIFIPPYGPGYVHILTLDQNAGVMETYGAELAAQWNVTTYWHLSASYSWLSQHENIDNPYLSGSPPQQAQVRSTVVLPWNAELTAAVFYVDSLQSPYGIGVESIPSYVRTDLGMTWRVANGIELGLWGKNLNDNRHIEFTSYKTDLITAIPRSVLGRVTWNW